MQTKKTNSVIDDLSGAIEHEVNRKVKVRKKGLFTKLISLINALFFLTEGSVKTILCLMAALIFWRDKGKVILIGAAIMENKALSSILSISSVFVDYFLIKHFLHL